MMIVSGILFLSICILMDHLVFEKLAYKIKTTLTSPTKNLSTTTVFDSDVEDEKQKIEKMTVDQLKTENLALQGLSKFYGNKLAVNQLYLGVDTSECFGLLVSWNDKLPSYRKIIA